MALIDSSATTPDLAGLLKQYFGYESFRALQEEVIHAALDGRDHASHLVDAVDVFASPRLDRVGQGLHCIGARERVHEVGDAGLRGDDLLGA